MNEYQSFFFEMDGVTCQARSHRVRQSQFLAPPISSFPSKNLFGAESQSLKRDNQTTFFYIHRKNGTASHVNTSKVAYIVIIYHLLNSTMDNTAATPKNPPKKKRPVKDLPPSLVFDQIVS